MSLWKRITPDDEKKAEEEIQSAKKSKEPSIEFYPEEPKYSFDEIICLQRQHKISALIRQGKIILNRKQLCGN